MNKHLSARKKWQDKANLGGLSREETAKKILETLLRDDPTYTLFERPQQLSKIYAAKWGIVPDFAIQNNRTLKIAFFETKRQGPQGNAHERACKYFAPGLQAAMSAIGGFPRPVFTIYMNGLTNDPKKVAEIAAWYEHPDWSDRYLLWPNRDIETIIGYWETTVKGYLS